MAVSLVQSPAGVASSANSPTSLAVTWASTTAGNLLVLFVSVTGSASPTVTTPTNWTVLQSITTTLISGYVFVFPNNPGGLTGLTLSCSATNGGISASFMEFSSMPPATNLEYSFTTNATGTVIPPLFTQNVGNTNDLSLAFIFSNATGSVSTLAFRSPEWAGNVNGVGSTAATTNTRNNTYWAVSIDGNTPTLAGSINVSVIWGAIVVRLVSTLSGHVTYTAAGGPPGIYVGPFYQGTIGG